MMIPGCPQHSTVFIVVCSSNEWSSVVDVTDGDNAALALCDSLVVRPLEYEDERAAVELCKGVELEDILTIFDAADIGVNSTSRLSRCSTYRWKHMAVG